ncbi:MBL fold metallo-hydrolase [Jeotgalibacillus haloalkalitolerans]|uniref:MBL fold metallo-hydrolase n=1 Tax=Jeotgalibacillus haloalkalitolerans TaxID=3104292 RepID=A0ABU5KHQ3_9BACL|nr:MBL fold metallo-hydrolase [Jeotgalibacillus sp. HH7-29]MDZ5710752.1 MBL fold metallo-hydrolase [Jeotgalibacillus sp. HH7-29]
MNIQLIRNATLVVHYAGKKFLVDPFLADKGAYPPFQNAARQDQNNPLVELPIPIDEVIQGVNAVILTHLHLDHYDEAAKNAIPKNMKVFVQNDEDLEKVKEDGFENLEVLSEQTEFEGVQLIKTVGEHGRGEILKMLGHVSGVVFKHSSEKTLYVAGDTVWYEGTEKEILKHQPEVIVANAGDNQFLEGGSLVMGKEDIYETAKAAPNAKIVAVHMEAVNHWALSRDELKTFAVEKGFADRLHVPEDGESYSF